MAAAIPSRWRKGGFDMGKGEYLAQLQALLVGRMAPAELERILAYYEEYFDEAGPEGAGQVVRELGSPAELAHRVLGHTPMQQAAPPTQNRRGLGGLWTALLALCAAPIALPLLAAAVAVVAAVILAVIVTAAAVSIGGVACILAGLYASTRSFSLLFQAGLSTMMYFSGLGMLTAGLGLLMIAGSFALAGLCFRGVAALLRRIAGRKEART